jgi:hypothetical protein
MTTLFCLVEDYSNSGGGGGSSSNNKSNGMFEYKYDGLAALIFHKLSM